LNFIGNRFGGISMERSVKPLLSITLIVAAVFVAMNRVAENARIEDWWLVVVLLVVGVLIYIWDWQSGSSEEAVEALVEPGVTSLDGSRHVAPPAAPAPAPVQAAAIATPIAPRVLTEAEADHAEIVKAYGEIRDTDARSDGMASSSTTDTQEARAIKGMVENIMDVGATGTTEEVDEIAGGPVDSMSKDHPRTIYAPLQPEPIVSTPPPAPAASVPAPGTPAPAPSKSRAKKSTPADGVEEMRDTEVRADAMASAATMDSVEAQESETGTVENIMETGATGTVEEVDEIAGGPAPSISKEQAIAAPPSAQPDDLTVIEGIGQKMAAALKAGGIDTFARLATTSEADIRTVIGNAGMRFAPSVPTWAQQASLADKGDWSGLKEYQATLKGGRKK
jgi:predicted flap endonuclease-1-like 5' DNA nuclease